jgi:hypothetical protein
MALYHRPCASALLASKSASLPRRCGGLKTDRCGVEDVMAASAILTEESNFSCRSEIAPHHRYAKSVKEEMKQQGEAFAKPSQQLKIRPYLHTQLAGSQRGIDSGLRTFAELHSSGGGPCRESSSPLRRPPVQKFHSARRDGTVTYYRARHLHSK